MNIETLIVGGAPCTPEPFRKSLIAHAGRLVAVDAGGNLCFAAGRAPNVLVGDMDSISNEAYEFALSAGTRIVELCVQKDVTDLEVALDLSASEKWMRPTLTAVLGGRSDHELAVWGAFVRLASIEPMISEPATLAVVLTPGGRASFQLEGSGRTFSLLSPCGSAVVSAHGVEYPLEHGTLTALSGQGVSNRVMDQAVVTVHEGTVLLISDESSTP